MGNRTTLLGLNVAVDWWMGLFIGGVVVVPSTCFLTTVPHHPALVGIYGASFAYLYAGLEMCLAVASVVLLCATVFCDPGFVFPERWALRRHDMLLTMEQEFDPAMDVHFCPVCLLFLSRYDHHCPILGACIGKRNLWSFVLFCTSVSVMCILSVPATITFLVQTVQLPSSVPSVEHVLLLVSFDLLKALFALGGAFYGGGYCTVLAITYWVHIFNNQHSYARRRAAYVAESQAADDLLPRSNKRWLS